MKKIASRLGATALAAAFAASALVSRANAPAGRYAISNGTVYDTKTKLTWQQALPPPTMDFTWPAASSYCSGLSLNGTGWRLPTVKELTSILDFSQPSSMAAIDPNAFPGTVMNAYWSATPYAPSSGDAWYVWFAGGDQAWSHTAAGMFVQKAFVRCVR
jgi:hypothetical protein